MADDAPEETTAEIDAKIARARAKLGMLSPERSAVKRKHAEKKAKKQINHSLLRKTGRTELFTFRCRADLVKRMKAIAKKESSIAACMDEAIQAWLKNREAGTNGS